MHIGRFVKVVSCLAVLAVLGCSGAQQQEEYGGANIAVNANALTNGGIVGAVYVHVYGTTARGAAFDQIIQAASENGIYEVRLNRIPIGTYAVHGWAYADRLAVPGVDPADWESVLPDPTANITAKATTTVQLRLQQTAPPDTVNNAAPTIDSVVASQYLVDSTAGAQDVISLAATASDANGDAVSALWFDGGIGGTFSSDVSLATTWTPPADFTGTATLTLTVSDPFMAASAVSLRFDVSPGNARGTLVISPIEINNWPDILNVTADNAQIEPGGSATIVVDVSDFDNDPVAFTWTEACTGTLTGVSSFTPASGSVTGTAAVASFGTVYTPPAGAVACTLTASVDDGRGGTNAATFVVNVRARPVAYAPDFTTAIMSPTGLAPTPITGGMNVNYTVAAVETLANLTTVTTANFTWAATVNGAPLPASVFTDVSGNGTRMVFAVPACTLPGTFNYSVRSTAIGTAPNGIPNNSFIDFPFTVTCP